MDSQLARTIGKVARAARLSPAEALDLGTQEPFKAPDPPPSFWESPEIRRLVRIARALDRRTQRLIIAAALSRG
jgi:hypothetical protein